MHVDIRIVLDMEDKSLNIYYSLVTYVAGIYTASKCNTNEWYEITLLTST